MVAMKQLTDNSEENTQGFNLTPSQMPHQRRTESPWFWLQLVGGSLVFHGALLAIALPLTARLSAAQSGTPTPVEFVELSELPPEPSPEPATIQPPTESAASPDPAPAPIETQPTVNEAAPPNDISFAPGSPTISPLPLPAPEVALESESSPEPAPEISPSPEIRAEAPFETAAVPPQPDSLPLPVLPSAAPAQPPPPLPEPPQVPENTPEALRPEAPVPEPVVPEPTVPEPSTPEASTPEAPLETTSDRPQSESPSTESPSTETTATALPPSPDPLAPQPGNPPGDPGLQTTAINIPVPDVSEAIAAPPSTVDADDLSSANSEAAPVGVTLNLANSSRVAPRGDEPVETLEVARANNSSTNFLPDPSVSACQVTPDVLNRAGTPIALQVTTDEQGQVLDVSVHQSSGSLDYDQLAVCLVKEQWQFEPATVLNAGETQRQAIASDELLITLTINRN